MVKVLDFGLEVSLFELQSGFFVHFWTNTLGKSINLLILSAMGHWCSSTRKALA